MSTRDLFPLKAPLIITASSLTRRLLLTIIVSYYQSIYHAHEPMADDWTQDDWPFESLLRDTPKHTMRTRKKKKRRKGCRRGGRFPPSLTHLLRRVIRPKLCQASGWHQRGMAWHGMAPSRSCYPFAIQTDYASCMRVCPCPPAADDLHQATFTSLHRHLLLLHCRRLDTIHVTGRFFSSTCDVCPL
jgi:hypothetical protein